MSLLVAIRSVVFYYMACTPCNDARARYRQKQQAKADRHEKLRIQTEQPGLYRHPSPFHTNPFWQEDIDIGPKPPKGKNASKNASQRGLNSSSIGRNSTSASLTCTSSHNEVGSTTSPGSPTIIPEGSSLSFDDDGWNKRRYQREDEELWGHDLSRMGHKLVDNIVKASESAGRMIKGDLAPKDRLVTDEERSKFYFTPRNPPVNEYHPPIVGSAPARKDAFQWMLQPPPPAKVMEGRVPVSRAQSFNSSASKRSAGRRAGSAKPGSPDEQPLDRLVREKAMQDKLLGKESPSEAELIDVLIGRRSRNNTVSSRGRSMSLESDKCSDPSTDGELVERRRRPRARPAFIDSDDSDTEHDEDYLSVRDSPSRGRGMARAAQRPKLGTIHSAKSNSSSRVLSNRPSGTSRPESLTPRAATPSTPAKAGLGLGVIPAIRDENTPIAVAS
ncbi:hypothetical protein B0T11DRAFT_110770 [Plectosphaerella cucumerina]|uniref:Signal peptide-containing protein n=1 Tax=Plectosphaerella cucumerina TaxID=40658 RepID=A0A8K0X307_9PEZI|nr:hypothetical protein B0T11DRAFT_110770 [Plectosphaerella cucumerina]